MNYSLFLARRLSLGAEGRKSSPAVAVATVAVALSVVVMLAAVAIVFGFRSQISSRLEGFNADISVRVAPSAIADESAVDNLVSLSPSLRQLLLDQPYVEEVNPQITAPAILKTPEDFKGVYLRTLAGSQLADLLSASIEEGKMPDFVGLDEDKPQPDSLASQILVSRIAADRLGLKAGEKIDVYFITDNVRVRRLLIKGIFNTHFDTYDNVFVFGHPALLREIGGLSDTQATTLSISTSDLDNVDYYASDLQGKLITALSEGRIYKPYKVESVREAGSNYFHWLDMLDMNVIIVLTLMTFVACITLVSGMLIVIVDKKRFIALVKALGMPGRGVRRIFIYLAVRVAVVGLLVGDAVALALLWLQRETHFIPLDPDSYYMDFVPVEISWPAFLAINIAVLLIAYLVLILPARFVGSVSVAETLSSE